MSRRFTCLIGMLCVGLVLSTVATAAPDDKKDTKDTKDTKPVKAKWMPVTQFAAKLGNVDAGTKSVELYSNPGWKKIDLYPISDDLHVRRANPPADFDEKGRIKKYTSKELSAMRGTGPEAKYGYQAEFDALKRDQLVTVIVSRKAKPAGWVKPTNKKEREEAEAEFKPQVTLIVIDQDVK